MTDVPDLIERLREGDELDHGRGIYALTCEAADALDVYKRQLDEMTDRLHQKEDICAAQYDVLEEIYSMNIWQRFVFILSGRVL